MLQMAKASTKRPGWEFEEGAELAPGRTILSLLGGGSRYEAYLVWDDRLFTMLVAKVLRPDQVEDERALRDITLEAKALERLQHPVLVRGFGAILEGPHPHVAM